MNRLFDEAMRGFGIAGAETWPQLEATDHDKELRVTAELPGLDDNDVEIRLEDGVLSLRGEKRADFEDKQRHYSERFYGQFERRITLPADVDEDSASATFKNGVLT